MTPQDLSEWDEDLEVSIDQEYTALLRAIRWAKGFGLLFLQCSPAEGERLMKRIKQDIGGKRFNRLALDESVTDLYQLLQSQPDVDQTDVLFITGLEKSLIEYMEPGPKRTYTAQDFYAEDKVPRLLGQLNLQREILKEKFPLCFVFLVPRYAIKYLVRKAPDFFDWRAGVWEFVSPQAEIQQKSQQFLQEGDYEHYLSWPSTQRRERIFEIDDLVSEGNLADDKIASLRLEQGNIYIADGRYGEAIASYDAALRHNPDDSDAWYNRGNALGKLERYEEAIASYDRAIKYKPVYHKAWYNRGTALGNLERYEEAIASYDRAIKYKPVYHKAWYNRGVALRKLERYEEAIASYDQAIKHNPDDHDAWFNRGNALGYLERYEEAIASLDKALEIKPDKESAHYNKACYYALLGNPDAALESLQQAINFAPDKYRKMAKTDTDFDSLRHNPRFQALIADPKLD